MSLPDRFTYHFYPVGQGLFATGSIHKTGEDVSRFLWVYDCGTSSAQKLVKDSIQRLKTWSGSRPRIDLLVLSHFDQDHISGVCRLLEHFEVGTLMLPYMHLRQRLVVAFAERVGGRDDLMRFFINPVGYFAGVQNARIDRILFVPPSSGDGPPANLASGSVPPRWGDGPPEIDFEPDKEELERDADKLMLVQTGENTTRSIQVSFLRRGSALSLFGLWEFVPYNDDPERNMPPYFVAAVESRRERLLNSKGITTRGKALAELVEIYDEEFGDDSESRNELSLFLYSGPIYQTWRHAAMVDPRYYFRLEQSSPAELEIKGVINFPLSNRCSILYPGDGYLDKPEKLQRLTDYLDPQRMGKIGVLQVMHHGSKANWYSGLAGEIAPVVSVFSSNPSDRRYQHPDVEVLKDFWKFGSIQVDKAQSFTAIGHLA